MSVEDSDIISGDILCVRKDMDAVDGDIVIAVIDNEFIVKTFYKHDVTRDQGVEIWGVVTGLARSLKKNKK